MSTSSSSDAVPLAAASLVPYAVVAWAISATLGDVGFWAALGWLVAARSFFAVIEFAGSFALWRMRGRKRLRAALFDILARNHFPPRYFAHDDYLNYLGRVTEDEKVPAQVKIAAREIELMAQFYEGLGMLAANRFNHALEAALEEYSPRAKAPVIGREA